MSSTTRQQSVHRQHSEVEEIKDFRRLHRANCFIYFLHLALLCTLFFIFIMWVIQPVGPPRGPNPFLGLVFDPETQTFVQPGMQNGTQNGTNPNITVPEASITNILRDFILSTIGSSGHQQQPFQKPQDRDGR